VRRLHRALAATRADRFPPAEKLISPADFARVFCDDLDLPHTFASEIAGQIETQVKEQSSVAEVAIRTAEEVAADVEKDLRVVLNVSGWSQLAPSSPR
jgi:hypothetical protein